MHLHTVLEHVSTHEHKHRQVPTHVSTLSGSYTCTMMVEAAENVGMNHSLLEKCLVQTLGYILEGIPSSKRSSDTNNTT